MMLSRTTHSVLVRPNPISCRLGLSRSFATTPRPGPAIPFATTSKPATATPTPTPTTPAATTATPKGSTGSGSGSDSDSGSGRPIPNTLYDYIIGNRSTILVTFAVVSTLGYAWRCNQMEKACKQQIKIREYVIDDLQLALTRAEENQRATLELIEQHTGKRKRAPATTSTSISPTSSSSSSSSGWWPFSSSSSTPTPTPKSSTTSTPTHKPSGSLYDDVLSLYRSHPLLAAPNIVNSADVARHLTNNDTTTTITTTPTPTPAAAASTPTPTPTPATKPAATVSTPSSTTTAPTAPTAPASGARPLM